MDLKETDILGQDIDNHWYYSSKAKAMTQFLGGGVPSKILDVGAGSGFFSKHLLSNTSADEAWCVDISYQREYDEVYENKTIYYRRSIDSIDANLTLLMDVLEHVDDDVGLLRDYVSKVPVGSKFLITVPAFQFLWSGHDEFLEHKRRYTLAHLEKVISDAGLDVIKGSYFFGAVFPLAFVTRMFQKIFQSDKQTGSQLSKHGSFVNALLKSICFAEVPLISFNRVAGLSVICLAVKG